MLVDFKEKYLDFTLKILVPCIGNITVLAIILAPWKAVKLVNDTKTLGDLNPIPFLFMISNAFGWIVYRLIVKDWFVFVPNLAGYMFGMYYALSAFRWGTEQFQNMLIIFLVSASGIIFTCAGISFINLNGDDSAKKLGGILCVVILCLFYASPLSELSNVNLC
jgi:solute carrier family 50 protein (sugar transporter)